MRNNTRDYSEQEHTLAKELCSEAEVQGIHIKTAGLGAILTRGGYTASYSLTPRWEDYLPKARQILRAR